ncbi:DUF418 domain-containing protein [Priestia megaterium]
MKRFKMNATDKEQRIEAADVLKGIALIGILLMNMPDFYSPAAYYDNNLMNGSKMSYVANGLVDIVVGQTGYALLAILFGFGFMKMFQRTYERQVSFTPFYVRRMTALLLVGAIHAVFIWHGDMIVIYSFFALIMLFFQEAKKEVLLAWGTGIFSIYAVIMIVILTVAAFANEGETAAGIHQPIIDQALQVYGHGSFASIFHQRLLDWYYAYNLNTVPFLFLSLFPLFLLGGFMAKSDWFEGIEEYIVETKWLCLISFIAYTVSSVLPYALDHNVATSYIHDTIGGTAGAIFVVTLVTLAMRSVSIRKIMQPFAFLGRMILTNYIVQSIVCTFLFYSYGLGYYGHISIVEGLAIAGIIIFIQLLGSWIWMSLFSDGPLEKLIRYATYGRSR